jgi:predicted outer membrane repeat protein
MYWTNWSTGKIQRANLDGSGVEDLVTGLPGPARIALDVAAGKMYWMVWGTHRIQRANMSDGSGVEDLLTGLDNLGGMALDVAGGKMYWTNNDPYPDDKIRRANMGGRTDTFQLINGVALYGGFPSGGGALSERDPNQYETILSGDLAGDDVGFTNNDENSYHVVIGSGTDPNAILDGFTITAGNADGSGANNKGGGMYNNNANPTVTDCTFIANYAYYGGGAYNYTDAAPTFTDCTFTANTAGWGAGAMYNHHADPVFVNCTFTANSAPYDGGAMRNYYGSPLIINCLFVGNSASDRGGGMVNIQNSPELTNCVFSGNTSENDAGAIYNQSSDASVDNCTFSENSAVDQGGAIFNHISANPSITNCILYRNSDIGGTDESAQIVLGSGSINYSCVQGLTGGLGGTGNIGTDPCFVDADGPDDIVGTEDDDLHLLPVSLCIDIGDPCSDYSNEPQPNGNRINMGAYGNTEEAIPKKRQSVWTLIMTVLQIPGKFTGALILTATTPIATAC